jgi:hypothetical protein
MISAHLTSFSTTTTALNALRISFGQAKLLVLSGKVFSKALDSSTDLAGASETSPATL